MDDDTRKSLVDFLSKGVAAYHAGVKHSIQTLEHAARTTASFVEGALFPALHSVAKMNEDVARSLMAAVRGERPWREIVAETSLRLGAGHRFSQMVHTWGRDLFGSARFAGETVLAEDGFFRLTYIPPAPGARPAQPIALFHAGGCIPYSDRLFRLVPGYDFYGRFLERGLAVYAMELRGDRDQVDYSALTIDALVHSIATLSTHAFVHNRERKLVLEGYCGQGTQALTYVLARPDEAEHKFGALCLFVAPVDGARCGKLATAAASVPDLYHEALMSFYAAIGNYVPGESVQIGLDLPLEALFHKSPLGYFATGWSRTDLARVVQPDELTPAQRRDLAGAYWVSADCSRRFPVPVGIARFTSALFKHGIAADGTLPHPVLGRSVGLAALRDRTRMPVLGFYGGRDPVTPDATAHVLGKLLGPRYTHVVHADAGHVTYVLSPKLWQPGAPGALAPNPVDLIEQAMAGQAAEA